MKIIVWKILFFLVFLILIAVVIGGMPVVGDVPDDVTVQEISVSGKRYLFIDGSWDKVWGFVSVVGVSNGGDEQHNELIIEKVEVFWPPLTSRAIITYFPICVEINALMPGTYTVLAREHGKKVKLYSFTKPPDSDHSTSVAPAVTPMR